MVKRRETVAGVSTVVGMAVTGVTTWLFTREGGGNDSDGKGAQSTPESGENNTSADTGENEMAPKAGKEDVENQSRNENEQPEAANPEPNPEGPETNESAINESRAGSEPSASDVTITGTELVTEPNAATVTGVATNEAGEPVTIELEVTFLKDGEQIGRPALNGTTDLPAGETWEFTVSGRGSEYSAATDYEIAKSVQTRG